MTFFEEERDTEAHIIGVFRWCGWKDSSPTSKNLHKYLFRGFKI